MVIDVIMFACPVLLVAQGVKRAGKLIGMGVPGHNGDEEDQENKRRIIDMRRRSSASSGHLFASSEAEGTDFGFGAMKSSEIVDLVELGSGFGGVVYKSIHLPTGRLMARKLINSRISSAKIRKALAAELATLRRCHHPNILHCYGAFLTGLQVSIALEYMDCGSFDVILKKRGPIPEPVLTIMSRSVLLGLVYLHRELNIMHRDLKPSNILLNSRGEIKICDFGESIELVNSLATSLVGTTGYMAPERVRGGTYSIKSDIWSLGITLVELATGRFPYFLPTERRQDMRPQHDKEENLSPSPSAGEEQEEKDRGDILSVVELWESISADPSPSISTTCFSPAFKSFVDACLVKDHDGRPDLYSLVNHPFLQSSSEEEFQKWLEAHRQKIKFRASSPAKDSRIATGQ